MESIDFRIRVNYISNSKNCDKDFYESDFKSDARNLNVSPFSLLKQMVEKFSQVCNNINYYVFTILVNEHVFEIISNDIKRILTIEGFKSYGSGGGDAFPVSIGILDFDKNIRIEFMEGKFVSRNI